MSADQDEDRRSLFEHVLDMEMPVRALRDAVIALDLIASGSLPQGIASEDMPGLKRVTSHARDLADVLRQNWTAMLRRAEAEKAGQASRSMHPGDGDPAAGGGRSEP